MPGLNESSVRHRPAFTGRNDSRSFRQREWTRTSHRISKEIKLYGNRLSFAATPVGEVSNTTFGGFDPRLHPMSERQDFEQMFANRTNQNRLIRG
jgi:hypothetical protein